MRLGNSQREILHLLRRQGALTVQELSRCLGISSVAVRQHLEVLQAEGLLSGRVERRPGRGRPRRVFELTEAAGELFPRGYAALAQVILEHLEQTGGGERVDEVFSARRAQTLSEIRSRLEDPSLEGRVRTLAEYQDQAGYMAEWEREEDGSFRLREHNCAICKIARRFPQACASELRLIEELTGADVVREQHLASGEAACSYRIRARDLN